MLQTRIDPLERDIAVLIADTLSPAAQSRALADYARETIADIDRRNAQTLGRQARHRTYVDGREGAPLDSVKPSGRIIAEWDVIDHVLTFIMDELRRRSPVRSGRWRSSHILMADGVEITLGSAPPRAAEFVFVNPEPYSRKIELGRMRLSVETPIYEAVEQLARRRFGAAAKTRYTWTAVHGGSRSPSIVVTAR